VAMSAGGSSASSQHVHSVAAPGHDAHSTHAGSSTPLQSRQLGLDAHSIQGKELALTSALALGCEDQPARRWRGFALHPTGIHVF